MRALAAGGFLVVALYVGSYLVLTLSGRYEPGMISAGVTYEWAPRGFFGPRWKWEYAAFYFPLYQLDVNFWHQPRRGSPDGA
jgi:hypothetical protein